MCCILKNFFLFTLSLLLNNCEESFSACATYHLWVLSCHTVSSKHEPRYVLSLYEGHSFQLIILSVLLCAVPAILNLPHASVWGGCYHVFCTRQSFLFCFAGCGVGFYLFALESLCRMVPFCNVHKQKIPVGTGSDGPLFLRFWMWVFCLCVLGFFNKECSGVNYSSSKQYALTYSLPFKEMCQYIIFTLEL